MKSLSSVESWNSVFEWGSLFLVAGTVAFGAGAILTSRIIKAKQEALIGEANTKAAEANKGAAEANERAAKLEKDAAEARLELAKIDPVNRPITSIRADIWLWVRGKFVESNFDKTNPVNERGPFGLNVSLDATDGSLVELQREKFDSLPALTTPNNAEVDGRSFSMSFVWPRSDFFAATQTDALKNWIERTNPSTAVLDKILVGVLISLPPTDPPGATVDILYSSCVVTINGSIRRNFSVPASARALNIFCPVKHD